MSALARTAGVSKMTVSLALRNDPRVSPPVRARIQSLADQLGYQRNPVVSHLMTRLRAETVIEYKATLAILNAHEDPEAFRQHPTIPKYVEGCRFRAHQQGYGLDEFWLSDPKLNGTKLARIFRSRGIQGALVVGMMDTNRLPAGYENIWRDYPCVVTGLRTHDPVLPFSCTDQHDAAYQAVHHALRLGYQRPALVLDTKIDQLIERRFSAGMYVAQQQLPPARRVPPFYTTANAAGQEEAFRAWFEKVRPDVIITLYHTVATWIKKMGLEVPDDVGLIQLEWRPDHAHWAGMNQHNELVGATVVSMILHMIYSGERNIATGQQYGILINSSWVEGKTVKQVRPAHLRPEFALRGVEH